jgi:hypothetical protein
MPYLGWPAAERGELAVVCDSDEAASRLGCARAPRSSRSLLPCPGARCMLIQLSVFVHTRTRGIGRCTRRYARRRGRMRCGLEGRGGGVSATAVERRRLDNSVPSWYGSVQWERPRHQESGHDEIQTGHELRSWEKRSPRKRASHSPRTRCSSAAANSPRVANPAACTHCGGGGRAAPPSGGSVDSHATMASKGTSSACEDV